MKTVVGVGGVQFMDDIINFKEIVSFNVRVVLEIRETQSLRQ